MGQGYAEQVQADCLSVPENNSMNFFRNVNVNITFSSPECSNQRDSGFFACGSSPLLTPPKPYTQTFPQNYIATADSIVYGRLYGQSSGTDIKELTFYNGDPVYFSANDFAPWLPTTYCPFPYNRYTRSGPAFTMPHCYGTMRNKLKYDNSYFDRLNHEWIDAGVQVPYPDYNYKLCGKGCPTKNWLIMAHPATQLWTSNPEPFKIKNFYEESGYPVPNSALYGGNYFVPFCAPMNVRKADGTLAGQYYGLSYLTIFCPAVIVFPVNPYLPPDPYSPVPPPNTPKVNPNRAFYSLEVWTFLTGRSSQPNYPVGSPLLSKVRYWLYSLAPGGPGQTRDWRQPFRVIFQSTIYADYPTRIDCNIIGTTEKQRICINQTNMKVLTCY